MIWQWLRAIWSVLRACFFPPRQPDPVPSAEERQAEQHVLDREVAAAIEEHKQAELREQGASIDARMDAERERIRGLNHDAVASELRSALDADTIVAAGRTDPTKTKP